MKRLAPIAMLLAGCEITIEPMPPPAAPPPPPVVVVVTPPPPPPTGSLLVSWAFQGTYSETYDCELVNAGRVEVVVYDAWDFVVFDSGDLDPPLDCGEGGVDIADLPVGDYLVEVWAYDEDWGFVAFEGAAGMYVDSSDDNWAEIVLERR